MSWRSAGVLSGHRRPSHPPPTTAQGNHFLQSYKQATLDVGLNVPLKKVHTSVTLHGKGKQSSIIPPTIALVLMPRSWFLF